MIESVDLDHWGQMPQAELWECVALYCDIEPRSTDAHRLSQHDVDITTTKSFEKLDNRKVKDYQDRLAIACSHLKNRSLRHVDGTIHPQPERTTVSVPAFIQWAAVSMRWPIREDIRSIGDDAATAEQAKVIEAKGMRERDAMLNPPPFDYRAIAPEWSYWPATRPVNLPQAIALSMNIDPGSLMQGAFWWKGFSDLPIDEKFHKRLDLAEACFGTGNQMPLSDFATWAVEVAKLDRIPPELAAMAPNESAPPLTRTSATEAAPAAAPKEVAAMPQATGQHERAAMGGKPVAKTGRPRTIEMKAEIVRRIVIATERVSGDKFTPGALPGKAADLQDACKRIEKALTGKSTTMTATTETFKEWVHAAGYSFPNGRVPNGRANFWTHHAPTTQGEINAEVFTGVSPDIAP